MTPEELELLEKILNAPITPPPIAWVCDDVTLYDGSIIKAGTYIQQPDGSYTHYPELL